jgi:protein-L-isoaspartate(D-aspartate) O-methyltransferase
MRAAESTYPAGASTLRKYGWASVFVEDGDVDPGSLVAAARAHGVSDRRLLAAIRDVERSRFVPTSYVERADFDAPVPVGHDQVTTQPSLVAVMVEALGLSGTETVLEVGTGFGYQTALLTRLASFVWSIEWWEDLAAAAKANLAAAGVSNAAVVVGDGTLGLPRASPFDSIVVAAAAPAIPPPLAEQLAPAGRLVQPIGPGGKEDVTLFVEQNHDLVPSAVLTGARFVPLRGAHGVA